MKRFVFLVVPATALAGCLGGGGGECREEPVSFGDIQHVHGLGVAPNGTLFVATHHGLFKVYNDTRAVAVKGVGWDLMGFALHPEDASVMWSSGHNAPRVPNLGVVKSTDGGCSWKTVALRGQVDFHAMAVSPAEPDVLLGWHGRLYRSGEGGGDWERLDQAALPSALGFAGHPQTGARWLAATQQGVWITRDGGLAWARLPTPLDGEIVSAVAYSPARPGLAWAFGVGSGLLRSEDEGADWAAADMPLQAEEVVVRLAPHPTDPDVLYAGTTLDRLLVSLNGGTDWTQLPRPMGK